MVKNLKEMAAAEQHAIVDAVTGSAQQIWQAGLGAFARAQQEGSELFDKLVRDGVDLHELTQKLAGDRISGVAERAGRMASGSWDKIEKLFEERVARSLRALGVPSHAELDALRREVAELKAAVAAGPTSPKPPRRNVAAKPAAAAKAAPKAGALKAAARAPAKRAPKAAARHH